MTRRPALLLALLAAAPALAQARDTPPLPPPRPDLPAPAPHPATAPNPATTSSPATAPAPAPPAAEAAPLPPERPADLPAGPAAPAVPDDTACLRRLERLGARAEPLPALADGLCGAPKPLRVVELPDGIQLSPPATLTCRAAEALARWSTEVRVLAERDLGRPPRSLRISTSYECRGQNHDPDAKLSEHAFANAIDVMGFTFEGREPIGIGTQAEGTPEGRFQAAVRARACAFFRTVLGPGSDAEHGNHLHLDERERNAGHRLCQ
ncbi:extensin-like domain-containing protein [Methylobacterium sp. WSM2598]|uniref:extensin-like domain-containing protein n=1 Tax=Methylobacterium sp. WSM2598 TaxID=398261 RepID=UPI0003825371|nr:extensin family protein [Methylobacterium sp. WSM2598]